MDAFDEIIEENSDKIPDEVVGLLNGDSEAAVDTITDLISDKISIATTDEIATTTTLKTKQEE